MTAATMSVHHAQQASGTRTWEALGTYAYLAVADPALAGRGEEIARDLLDLVDRTCSRFRADSDLSRANAAPGRWMAVHPLLAAATAVAIEAAEVTDGAVDPCLGRAMVSLGYDRNLGAVRARDPGSFRTETLDHDPDAWRQLRVDSDGALRVPAGCALDLGAVAKAWASDLVAATVAEALGCPVLVSLGGDVRIGGDSAQPWPVRVTERPAEHIGQTVRLFHGGLATSTTVSRRWRAGAADLHHLLNPTTGRPTDGPWRTASAVGHTCVAANVATTAALVLGEHAVDWLTRRSVAARLVAADGSVHTVGDWPTSLEGINGSDDSEGAA